jgi:putrescine aminotransferase
MREICDRHGILLIADEVINGFGRTGKWFGIQHYPIQPDIMTVAKALSSGYQPVSAAMASQEVADAFLGTRKEALMGGITFGAHPVATAVALANIEIIERERLVQNSEVVGEYVGEQLRELKSRHKIVSDTRGIGLMYTVELQRNPEANEDFADDDGVNQIMPRLLAEQGLLARAGTSIAVAPPLVINREQVDELVDMLDGAIGNLEQELQIS